MLTKIIKNEFNKFNEMVQVCEGIVKQHGVETNAGLIQLSVQVAAGENNWAENGIWIRNQEQEKSINHIRPELKGTVVEEWINGLDFPIWRARLMYMSGRLAYKIHSDLSPRIHLPLITNPECLFIFPDLSNVFHMPADGRTWWIDTRNRHTAINCSGEMRLHLIASTEYIPSMEV